MRQIITTNRFEKELELCRKRGKNLQKIKDIILLLEKAEPLLPKHHDHYLIGNYSGRKECHIEPDWLLIYKIDGDKLILERTGTHSDLY